MKMSLNAERFSHVNALFKNIRNIFKCQLCSDIKKEDRIIFFWTCDHFYCLDCIGEDKPCVVCSAVEGKASISKQVKITENENILAIFRSISDCQSPVKTKNVDNAVVPNSKAKSTPHEKQNGRSQKRTKTVSRENSVLLDTSSDKSQIKSGKKALNVTKRNYKGETPLHLACRKGNISLMQDLIDAGASPNVQDNAGWTPLHDSIVFGRQDVIKFLLDNGARVNTPGHENMTALHQAIVEGNKEVTRLLLKYGADKSARNIFGETPLDIVKKYNITDMEEILLNTPAKFKPKPQMHADSRVLHPNSEVVLCGCNLDENGSALLEKFASQFKFKTVDKLSPQLSATHVIVPENEEPKISWNIIPGVLMACQVVSVQWLKESIEKDDVQAVDKYEVRTDFYSGFLKSQQNHLNQLPGLFSGCHFYFGGNFELYKTKNSTFLKTEIKILVERHGGVILSRNPDPESLALEKTIPYHADVNGSLAKTSYFIIYSAASWDPAPKYNMTHMKTLPVEWLLASIFKFELIDPNQTRSYMDYV